MMIEMGNNKPEGIMEDKATKKQMENLKKHFAGVFFPLEFTQEMRLKQLMKKCPVLLLDQLSKCTIEGLVEAAKVETTRRGSV